MMWNDLSVTLRVPATLRRELRRRTDGAAALAPLSGELTPTKSVTERSSPVTQANPNLKGGHELNGNDPHAG